MIRECPGVLHDLSAELLREMNKAINDWQARAAKFILDQAREARSAVDLVHRCGTLMSVISVKTSSPFRGLLSRRTRRRRSRGSKPRSSRRT
jgi:hypothetical protein